MHLGVEVKELSAFRGKAEVHLFLVVVHPAALDAAILQELGADFGDARLGQLHFVRDCSAVNRLVIADTIKDMNAG